MKVTIKHGPMLKFADLRIGEIFKYGTGDAVFVKVNYQDARRLQDNACSNGLVDCEVFVAKEIELSF